MTEIYYSAKQLLHNCKNMVYCYRRQNLNHASIVNRVVVENIDLLVRNVYDMQNNLEIVEREMDNSKVHSTKSDSILHLEELTSTLKSMMSTIPLLMQAQEHLDYVYLADLFEISIIPVILDVIEILSNGSNGPNPTYLQINCHALLNTSDKNHQLWSSLFNVSDCLILLSQHDSLSNYSLEDTTTGDYTLSVTINGSPHYLHSNSDPVEEARILASEYYNLEIDHYIVLGFGLGYHIQALRALDPTITIDIYETDLNVLGFAFSYMDLTALLSDPDINLHYDPDCTNLLTNITQPSTRLFIHYPSLQNIRNPKIAALLQEYFIQESSIRNRGSLLYQNYRRNRQKVIPNIDTIRDVFAKKDLYMIAAGPSLDNNVTLLKKHPKNSIILAVGTVFHKLLKRNIRPDYILISDPDPIVYRQIEGHEDEQIPLILLSTAHYSLADHYQGPKYRIYQQDFNPAMADAQKNHHMLYHTGGSVATLALDLGIRMHSSRIIFVGLDLAYTNNLSHTADTATSTLATPNEMITTPSVSGGEVSSTAPLIIYKKWIERRLLEEDCQSIPVIDATEGGARIEGTQIMSLAEAMSRS